MEVLFWALGATFLVSLLSLVGVFALSIKRKILNKILFSLVGFSAGTLIGGAFLHLIPEALEMGNVDNIFVYVLVGFSLFFVLERLLNWHHCHEDVCEVHSFAKMNLVGDGLHNFIDGLVIVASFAVDIRLGIVTTVAVMAHELPQEIGDFAVLLHGGYSRKKALLFNFFSSVLAILGALVGYFLFSTMDGILNILLPFTAGGFIYIAASDLIPELHKESKIKKAILAFLFFVIGIFLMQILKH